MAVTIPVKSELDDVSSKARETRLKITEIFYSLQGESNSSGWPTVFIRLTGCPLRCQYCDTAYAFTGGEWMEQSEVIKTVQSYRVRHITVTGGEPLAQKNCTALLTQLAELGYEVSLETSGAFSLADVDSRIVKVMDIKTPDSKESHRNDYNNLNYLDQKDQIKFVICSRDDFDWSVAMLKEHALADKCTVLFSPSKEQLEPKLLAEWVLEQQLPVRFQIQLHKILWGDEQGV